MLSPSTSVPTSAVRVTPTDVRPWLRDLPIRLRRHLSAGAYRPEIDGLRFLAIAVVVVGHLAERLVRFFPSARTAAEGTAIGDLVQRPGLGVYLFFAVSGFILTSQAQRAGHHPLSPDFLRRYFGRRVMRIEPPYLILLVATFLIITATGYAPEGTKQISGAPQSLTASLFGSLIYAHDLIWGAYPKLFPPGWSLEVEVQFYIFAPLFFALWLVCRSVRARVLLGTIGLIGASVLSLSAPSSIGPVHLETSLLRFLHFFWLGLVLAQFQTTITNRAARLPQWTLDLLGFGGLVFYLVLPNAPVPITSSDLAWGMALRFAALASVAAMFVAVFAPFSHFRRFCSLPWISLVGGACYSIYLTHLQTIQVMTTLAAKILPDASVPMLCLVGVVQIIAVLIVGLGFYAFVERVFMQPDWLRISRDRAIVPFVARISRQ